MRPFTHTKNVTRECFLIDIKAWHEGESTELQKWIGFGFFNHLFVSKNGIVTLYCNIEEGNKFYKVLEQKLDEKLFDELCDNFLELIDKKVDSDKEIYNLMVKIWPALTIFDEISKHPELASDKMILRLMRIRKVTESFSYELAKKINTEEYPKDYLFFKGELIEEELEKFIKSNNIIIKGKD